MPTVKNLVPVLCVFLNFLVDNLEERALGLGADFEVEEVLFHNDPPRASPLSARAVLDAIRLGGWNAGRG